MQETTISERLCQLRKRNAMTQKDLAKKLRVHITTIKNWESANCYPDARNICALADLFHVSTDYLLGRESMEVISLEGLTQSEQKQLLHIVQAYIDTLPAKPYKNKAGES